ncbi:hypothetical protein C7H09_10880 [Marinobacter fuscus]|uniref:Methyltransferase type 11 domain-containing protein n=1 Tax=Marinobacter fuscus TaxID=2109942 RepID=A0A2T1K9C9_9GAMM|nr:class I SAM-dependent methyltransferase [Marinobacter fuscus]PSF06132.1 hypothetical protein C7H09_10880 [Marinobacter fuscus]
MKSKHEKQWEKLGSKDPYWAVLTDPKMKGGKWKKDEFFQTGYVEIENIFKKLNSLEMMPSNNLALDFGCGVGRLSRALAKRFHKVLALDISGSMLEEARRANSDIGNVEFRKNSEDNLGFIDSNSIDFIYSNIVLQHMKVNFQERFIKEFCRVLSENGVVAFQTPSKLNLKSWRGWAYVFLGNGVLNLFRKLKHGSSGVMELHAFPKSKVINILRENGVSIVHVERFDSAGKTFESYMYFAKKDLKINT